MYLLDTNVLSELMKPQPDRQVTDWVASKTDDPFFTTSISRAELLAGVTVLPPGRKRRTLEDACARILKGFEGRILPFDEAASTEYAIVLAARKKAGRPVGTFDLIIAAIARAQGATVVTRDVGGFEFADVPLLNPWDPN